MGFNQNENIPPLRISERPPQPATPPVVLTVSNLVPVADVHAMLQDNVREMDRVFGKYSMLADQLATGQFKHDNDLLLDWEQDEGQDKTQWILAKWKEVNKEGEELMHAMKQDLKDLHQLAESLQKAVDQFVVL